MSSELFAMKLEYVKPSDLRRVYNNPFQIPISKLPADEKVSAKNKA